MKDAKHALSEVEGSTKERGFNHRGTEFAELGVFLDQDLFTPCPPPVLSGVEGRLRGEISEFLFTTEAQSSQRVCPP